MKIFQVLKQLLSVVGEDVDNRLGLVGVGNKDLREVGESMKALSPTN